MVTDETIKLFERELKHMAEQFERYVRNKNYYDKTIKVIFKYRGIYQGLTSKFYTDNSATFTIDIPGNLNVETLMPLLTDEAMDVLRDIQIEEYHISRIVGINFVSARVEGVY